MWSRWERDVTNENGNFRAVPVLGLFFHRPMSRSEESCFRPYILPSEILFPR